MPVQEKKVFLIVKKRQKKAGELLSIAPEHVLVASTGVIGAQLVMDVVEKGIEMLVPELDSGKEAGENAATAIMTTDTHKKEIAVECTLGGKTVTIGGMCKGAGMIHPNMGTMLSFITSDAAIDQKLLQQFLSEIVEDTFNMISVDGDTSTNDTCLVLCNGLAENPVITEEDEDGKDLRQPSLMLWNIWQNRLQEMVRDVPVFLKLPVMEQLQRKMQRLSASLLYVLL